MCGPGLAGRGFRSQGGSLCAHGPKTLGVDFGQLHIKKSKDERWLPLVRQLFHTMLIADATPYNAIRHLVLVKQTMHAATTAVAQLREEESRQRNAKRAAESLDPLSATMAFIRAAERVQVTRMD